MNVGLRKAILALAAVGAVWWVFPIVHGFADAALDETRGYFAVKRFGELPPGNDVFRELLRSRYGVTVEERDCVIADVQLRYIRGYNAYSEARLRARFGKDVLVECALDSAAAQSSYR
jgi:hypothetical protein